MRKLQNFVVLIHLSIRYFIWCTVSYTMRWTLVPRKVTRWTKFWGAQRSPELAFRSTDFRAPENLIFPALIYIYIYIYIYIHIFSIGSHWLLTTPYFKQVKLVNKQHWYWDRRMVKLNVNLIKSFRNYQQHCKTWKERLHMWKPLQQHFFCCCKTNIGRHLRRHCQMQLPIPMAAVSSKN